jgi:hypothetical protein
MVASNDALPERTRYQDTGCQVWHACLSCPLARCIYDAPSQALRVRLRDAKIARLAGEGWTAAALADRYGMSIRQVYRILSRQRQAA